MSVDNQQVAIPAVGTKHEVKAIKDTHPDYGELVVDYAFLRESYNGDGGYATYKAGYDMEGVRVGDLPEKTYLQRYPREAESKWYRRLEGAYYPNFIKRVVGIYAGLLTRETPSPRNYPPQVTEWMGEGETGWENQRRRHLPWCLVYPRAWFVVDRDQVEDAASAAAQGEPPETRVSFVHPDRMLDWAFDDDGEIIFAKYARELDAVNDPLAGHRKGTRVTVLARDGWWYYDLWDDEKSSVAPVTGSGLWPKPLRGHCPVAAWHSGLLGDEERDVSYIEYLCRVMLRLYNVLSQKSATEDGSCFPVLLVPVRGKDDLKSLNWNADTGIPFPAEAGMAPHFAGYDVAPLTHMTAEAERLARQLKELASVAIDNDAGDTGIARAYAFMLTDTTLGGMVTALERLELNIMDLVAYWEGVADGLPHDAAPGFTRRFDLVAAREEIANAVQLLEMELPPIAAAEVKRRAFSKFVQDLDPELQDEIQTAFDEEAEDTGADQWTQQVQQPAPGNLPPPPQQSGQQMPPEAAPPQAPKIQGR